MSKAADDTSTGLGSQEEDLRALAARHGLAVVGVHVDDGESGALRNRPGLLAWLADATSGRADHLLAWKIDRVSRGGSAGLATFLDVLEGVDRDGRPVSAPVRFLSVADNLDSDAPGWDLQAAVMGAVAKAERDATVARVRRSAAAMKAEGRWTGGTVPYGLRAVDNPDGPGRVLVEDPEEAAALREAARRILAGDTLPRVARWMTAHGPAPRRASTWSRQVLRQALTNTEGSARVLSASDRRALREALAVKTPNPDKGRRVPKRLLSGVLRCGNCGATLLLAHRVRQNPSKPGAVIYRCATRGAGGACPASVSIGADLAEEHVGALWLAGWGAMPETVAVRQADEGAEALEAAERDVDRLAADVVAARGADRLAALAALEAAEAEADRLRAAPTSALSVLRETGRTYADAWHAGTVEDRRDLILATAGPLTLGPGQRGRKGLDPARFVDAWRLDPAEADAALGV
ncbi:MAG: recombinase family protein [Motilibacteraceae bacterium]